MICPIANDSPPLEVPLALWRGVLALQASFGRARGEALGKGWGQRLYTPTLHLSHFITF